MATFLDARCAVRHATPYQRRLYMHCFSQNFAVRGCSENAMIRPRPRWVVPEPPPHRWSPGRGGAEAFRFGPLSPHSAWPILQGSPVGASCKRACKSERQKTLSRRSLLPASPCPELPWHSLGKTSFRRPRVDDASSDTQFSRKGSATSESWLGVSTTIARLRRSLCLLLRASAMKVSTLEFSRSCTTHEIVHVDSMYANRPI
jgi:hypothetical protein